MFGVVGGSLPLLTAQFRSNQVHAIRGSGPKIEPGEPLQRIMQPPREQQTAQTRCGCNPISWIFRTVPRSIGEAGAKELQTAPVIPAFVCEPSPIAIVVGTGTRFGYGDGRARAISPYFP